MGEEVDSLAKEVLSQDGAGEDFQKDLEAARALWLSLHGPGRQLQRSLSASEPLELTNKDSSTESALYQERLSKSALSRLGVDIKDVSVILSDAERRRLEEEREKIRLEEER